MAPRKKKNTNRKKAKTAKKPVSKKHVMHGCSKCGTHWIGPANQPHACILPSEERLFELVAENVEAVYQDLKKFAEGLGEQRIYASQKAVMFARKVCYMFVRPKNGYLELSLFLKNTPKHPLIHKSVASSKVRICHTIRIPHIDVIEAPLTKWIRESFDTCSG